jgi:hypothetical protein
MPHASLKVIPGVDQNKTPALNEAAISQSQLIRFIPDRAGLGLPQKLGGWTRYFPSAIGSTIRNLWAWADLNGTNYLAVGAEASLNTIQPNALLTSQSITGVSTSSGVVTLTFAGPYTFSLGSSIVVAGLIPSGYNGTYVVSASSSTTVSYLNITTGAATTTGSTVKAYGAVLSDATPQTFTDSSTVRFETTAGSSFVTVTDSVTQSITSVSGNGTTVTLGFTGPFTYSVGTVITVSGVSVAGYNGTYTVTASTTTSVSYLNSTTAAASGGTFFNANSINNYTSVYIKTPVSVGGLVLFGTYQCQAVDATDYIIQARDTLGNPELALWTTASETITSGTGSGTTATMNFTGPYTFEVGSTITVAGVTPSGYNGTYIVTSPTTTTSVKYANATTGAVTVFGTVSNFGAVPLFTTASGSSSVTVTLSNHGLTVGREYSILVAVTVGGLTMPVGTYIVLSVPSAYEFTLQAPTPATSTASVFQNGGLAQFEYYVGLGPLTTAGGTYGQGNYGDGPYGTSTALSTGNTGTAITATDWTLDNYGSLLVAVPYGGPIYIYDPTSGSSIATIIPTAPTANAGAFVAMPQRQVVAWGTTFSGIQDPLLIRYSDVNDLTSWVGTTVNQAGSYRIPRGSGVVGALQAQQQGLFWTDLALWAMQYVGPPLVYGFNEVGVGCGLIAPKAATVMSGVAYWMSQSQFFRYAGGGVEPILCPIWDVIFQDLDTTKTDHIRVAPNSRFNEVAWFYPTTDTAHPFKYAKYNIGLNTWDFGNLSRTAWINQSVLGPPIGANGGFIYQHETSPDADGEPMLSSFQTGYFALDEADQKTFVDQIWPDMKWGYYGGSQDATVSITFYATDFAGQTPTQYGPFAVTQSTTYVTPRMRGRLVSIAVSSSDLGSFWRLGNIRYRLQPDGRF